MQLIIIISLTVVPAVIAFGEEGRFGEDKKGNKDPTKCKEADTCCSEYGHCGKGERFCNEKCQRDNSYKSEICDAGQDPKKGRYGKDDKGNMVESKCPAESPCCSKHGYCDKKSHCCNKDCQKENSFKEDRCDTRQDTKNGRCGENEAGGSEPSKFGPDTPCCSKYGYCVKGPDFCSKGCQKGNSFKEDSCEAGQDDRKGRCGKDDSGNNEDSKCKADNPCCRKHGYCDKGADYCSSGYQSQNSFDDKSCDKSQHEQGRCGKNDGSQIDPNKCSGVEKCCNRHGYCGSGNDYCGSGCQKDYGTY